MPCRSCGQPVPPGRLACPACGTLVAAVAQATPADVADSTVAASTEAAGVHGAPEVNKPPEAANLDLDSQRGGIPGAYLPPSTLHRSGAIAPTGEAAGHVVDAPAGPPTWAPASAPAPAAPAVSAGGWIPPTPGVAAPVGVAPSSRPDVGSAAGADTPRETSPIVPGRASILADLPFDAPEALEGWLVALGGGLGIIGFFLPWTASLGTGLEGYLGSWGLGIVSHLPVFVFLVVITALAVLPNRVAPWVRTGVCGMVGGGILFGIVWLYLGSDASQLGALLCAVAGVLLIAGGIIAVAPGRNPRRGEDG
ncbi:MAG TPA: hypothetical protein VF971_09855 [Candidatus Limnocylindrales bacterium]